MNPNQTDPVHSEWLSPFGSLDGWRYTPTDIQPPLQLAWEFKSKGRIGASGGVAGGDGRVYFLTDSGTIHCVTESGQEVWKVGPGRSRKGLDAWFGPWLIGDYVVAVFWRRIRVVSRDGTLLWDRLSQDYEQMDEWDSFNEVSFFSATREIIVISTAKGGILPIDLRNGLCLGGIACADETGNSRYGRFLRRYAWENGSAVDTAIDVFDTANMSIVRWEGHPLFARSPTNSLAIDDLVVVCLGRDWFCLDSRTGRVVWAVTVAALGTRGSNVYDLASDGESVYTRADDVCACLDAQTGEVRWTIPKGRFSYTQSSGRRMRMAVSPSYLYFSGGDIVNGKKLLFVINKRDGEVVWQGQLRTYYDAPMVTPINGHLYAAHYDNLEDDWSLQCFESR